MKVSIASVLAVATIAACGAALLETDGLVTEKSAGWRFEASGAKGGAAFNPLEGWYPDNGGKLVSPPAPFPSPTASLSPQEDNDLVYALLRPSGLVPEGLFCLLVDQRGR